MARIGLLGRVTLILMAALAAVIVAALLFGHYERRGRAFPRPSAFPRIEQAAGIIDLLRETPPAHQARVLRAVNGPHLRASIRAAAPPETEALRRAPGIETLLLGYLKPGLSGPPRAYTDAGLPQRDAGHAPTEGWPARVVVPLSEDRILVLDVIESGRFVAASLFGLSAGLWIGLFGFGVAALAVFTLQREMRPLRRLAASAAAFDGKAPDPGEAGLAPGGAPDLKRLAGAVLRMQERVAGLLQERSFLIGAISHDLRTYLTRLRLRAEAVPEAGTRERMIADVDAMADLIDTALAFARGTTVSQRRGRVDLADLAAIEVAERDALGQPVRLAGAGDGRLEDAVVAGDAVALRRVLANLLDNAVKFGRSRVEVALEVAAGTCRVRVEDDGPGIGPTQRTAIFSPFYRIEGSRSRDTGGSGLGLAIARQIVEAHGGTIDVAPGRLGGACFAVVLPRAVQG